MKAKRKKSNVKEIIALTLALIAVGFLLINAIILLLFKEKIINAMIESLEESLGTAETVNLQLVSFSVNSLLFGWFVLAVIMSIIIYFIEKGKGPWYWLLIISLISLFAMRIETAVCGIISSFLYKNIKRTKNIKNKKK